MRYLDIDLKRIIIFILILVAIIFVVVNIFKLFSNKQYVLSRTDVHKIFVNNKLLSVKNLNEYNIKNNKGKVNVNSTMVEIPTDYGRGFNFIIYKFSEDGLPIGIMFSREEYDNEMLTVNESNLVHFNKFIKGEYVEK